MKDKLVKIFVASSGKVTALPGMVAPIDVPFFVEPETALAIAMEGHIVYANTVYQGEIRLTEDMLLDFMNSYGITDEDIRKKIEDSIRISNEYASLTSVKDIADKLLKLQGILVPGYDSLELIGKAIKAILGEYKKLSNFDETYDMIVALDKKIDDNYKRIDDSDIINSFKDIEDMFSLVYKDIDLLSSSLMVSVKNILSGVYLKSFKDVEDRFANLFNGDYIRNIKDIENLLETLHQVDHDTMLDKGGEYEISAKYIHEMINALKDKDADLYNKIVDIAFFASDTNNTVADISRLLASILNSQTIKSFKDVETAVNAVHTQGTDIELGKNTEFHITAQEMINNFKTIVSNIESNTSNISKVDEEVQGILNSNKYKTFKDVEDAISGTHSQGTDIELGKGTESHITADELLIMKEKIESALEAGAVILVEETITSAISKYLPQMPDNQTIYLNSNNKLEARTIKDLAASSSELNAIIGVKSNIQLQLDGIKSDYQSKIEALQGAGGFSGYFETNADKLAATNLGDGIYIVSLDETHSGNTTMWRYKAASSTWIYLGKFNIEVRDFASKPINLATEVTGVLPKSRIDVTLVSDVETLKTKVHTPGGDSYLDFGLPTQVSSTEIRNGLDKIKYLTAVNAASLIDDSKSQLFKTYSSAKIESILSNLLTADKVYLKNESDTIFMKNSDYQKHDNFDVLRKMSDVDGSLYYDGKSIFENKDIISIDGDFTDETTTLSTVFDLIGFCLSRSVVYPIQSIFYIQNNSKDSEMTVKILANTDMELLSVTIPPGQKRGYKYNPTYADMKVQIDGSYRLTVAVTAYKLQDFVDLINVKYHNPNSDIALGIGTEYECLARDLSRIVKMLKNINTEFLHNKNEDDYLAFGKDEQISAREIKNIVNTVNPMVQTAVLNITSNPKEITVPISTTNKTIMQFFKCVYDASSNNIVKLVSSFNNVDVSDFIGDTDRFTLDGRLYLKDSLNKNAFSTDYQSGKLCIFDYLSPSDIASMGGSIKSAQLKFTPIMNRPKQQSLTPPNGYVRYDNSNINILYDESFSNEDNVNSYNGSRKISSSGNAMIKFNFTGDKIRIYTKVSNLNISNNASIRITIDGVVYTYNEYNISNLDQVCVFELIGLNPLHSHDVVVENVSSNILSLDCVDISIGCKLQSYSTEYIPTGGILFKKSVNYYKYDQNTSSMVLATSSNPIELDFINSNTYQIPNITDILDYSIYVYAQDYTISNCTIKYLYGTQPSFIRGINNKSFGSNVSNIDSVQLNASITNDAIFRLVFGDVVSGLWYGYKNGVIVDVDITNYDDIITNGCTSSEVALLDGNVLNNFKSGISFGYLIKDNSGKVVVDDISVIVDYLSDLELITDMSKISVRYQYGSAKVTFTDMIGENIVINKI